jgi:hypothetical protein
MILEHLGLELPQQPRPRIRQAEVPKPTLPAIADDSNL